MKKKFTLPTILGVLVLIGGLIAGIYMINGRQEFRLSADVEAIPKNVRFSNITDSSVTVSWTTDIESIGFVKWGTTESGTTKVVIEEGASKSYVHSANIVGLESSDTVFVKINSDTKDYDNGGTAWQANTSLAKVSQGTSLIASGTVLLPDTQSPAKSLVYLTVNGIVLSSLTSDEGSFIIPLSNYVENIPETSAIEISVNAGLNGTAQAVIYPKAIKSIPTIVIGKTYDFRSLEVKNTEELPKSSLSVPESVEVSSRFEVQKSEAAAPNIVTLESIDDGEIILTTDPEFFGKGPQNAEIEISVESELQQGEVTTDANGNWTWNPPNDLEPGEHTVTLKWRDLSGIIRTVTRNFVVSAAEGPAFESTPSATPILSPTSTPISTSVASSTPKTATSAPTPETGSLTPTLGLFILGIGILLSSVFVWNKSYAER